jgi:integrase
VVKLIRASAVNEDKEELYAYQWKPLVELGAPEVNKREQRTPTFTREEIERMLQNSTGKLQVMVALFGATGPRKSECLGLEVAHYDGHSILIEQSITITSTPDDELKTEYAPRRVELHPHLCAWLDKYLNGRKTGYIFQNRKGKPLAGARARLIYPRLAPDETGRATFRLHLSRPATIVLQGEWKGPWRDPG